MPKTKERTTRRVEPVTAPVHAWPNQSEASRLLGVEPSTLLRRELPYEEFGGREKRLSPFVVLREAMHFKRTPVQQVAAGLYEIALERASKEQARQIAIEVDAFLIEHEQLRAQELTRAEFLAEARRSLPRGIFKQVEATYLQKPASAGVVSAFKVRVGKLPALAGQVRRRRRRPA